MVNFPVRFRVVIFFGDAIAVYWVLCVEERMEGNWLTGSRLWS